MGNTTDSRERSRPFCGIAHNQAIETFGVCECECHHTATPDCWCASNPTIDHPYQLGHNDAIRHLGHCPACRVRQPHLCQVRTDPALRSRLETKAGRDRTQRLMRGQIRSSADAVDLARMQAGLPPRR